MTGMNLFRHELGKFKRFADIGNLNVVLERFAYINGYNQALYDGGLITAENYINNGKEISEIQVLVIKRLCN